METSGVPKARGIRKAPGGLDTSLTGCARLLPGVLLGLRSEGSPGTWMNVCVAGGSLGTVQGMQMLSDEWAQGSAWWQLAVFCSGILNILEMLEILLWKEVNFSGVSSGFHRQGMPVGYNWRTYCSVQFSWLCSLAVCRAWVRAAADRWLLQRQPQGPQPGPGSHSCADVAKPSSVCPACIWWEL